VLALSPATAVVAVGLLGNWLLLTEYSNWATPLEKQE